MKINNYSFPSKLTLSLLVVALLSGCAAAVLGTGIAVGAIVATDRRTSGTQLEDETIELKGFNAIKGSLGDRAHISITSYDRRVLLTGEASSNNDKVLIEKTVSKIENVHSIVNDIAIMPNSDFARRSEDAIITAKVKTSLFDGSGMHANAIKVVTERGVVYLLGKLTSSELEKATRVAREVSGVVKVVRVAEVIPGK
jgi:osmotically-inducible protein OsmY